MVDESAWAAQLAQPSIQIKQCVESFGIELSVINLSKKEVPSSKVKPQQEGEVQFYVPNLGQGRMKESARVLSLG